MFHDPARTPSNFSRDGAFTACNTTKYLVVPFGPIDLAAPTQALRHNSLIKFAILPPDQVARVLIEPEERFPTEPWVLCHEHLQISFCLFKARE
jgi:hypothetical protein